MISLTDQQAEIVRHVSGHALVFAVAGSGKTTCMVHRIQHLLAGNHARPPQILATSFNTAAVQEIRSQLSELGVRGRVDCCTLHALGLRIIREAIREGLYDERWNRRNTNDESHGQVISEALTRIAIADGVDTEELGVDWEEVRNQISIWKGKLTYTTEQYAALPPEVRNLAKPADHENELFLRIFSLSEAIRGERFLLTFDDMLRTGWELLARHEPLLRKFQERYRFIMVDEFQDVNYAQYAIVDLISRRHGNYMAIGDDDQCIYEWRGADPRFILEFEKRYGARVFAINDNFRSSGFQTALANGIISRNKRRYVKHLNLTRGFEGQTRITANRDDAETAQEITREISKILSSGGSPDDLVVLIRLYSQTAFLETSLIDAGISYRITGGEPFYRRQELVTLFQYLSLAVFERDIRNGHFPDEPARLKKYLSIFEAVIHRPRRYIPRDFARQVARMAAQEQCSVLDVLAETGHHLKTGSRKQVEKFILLINNLEPRLRRSAGKALRWLVSELDYEKYLIAVSGIRELGMTRVQSVAALINFARSRGSCLQFLDEIRGITLRQAGSEAASRPVEIMTIYRAKGLEWDTVFIPGCNDGMMPCLATADGEGPEPVTDVESECRLFYVAVTRARRNLHIYYSRQGKRSRFLDDPGAEDMLEKVRRVKRLLGDRAPLNRLEELRRLCALIGELHLERYLARWAPGFNSPARLAKLVGRLEKQVAKAARVEQAHADSVSSYEATLARYQERIDHRRQQLTGVTLIIRPEKRTDDVNARGKRVSFDIFEDGRVMAVGNSGVLGELAWEKDTPLDPELLDWTATRGELLSSGRSGELKARLTAPALRADHPALRLPEVVHPGELPEKMKRLVDPALERGLRALRTLMDKT